MKKTAIALAALVLVGCSSANKGKEAKVKLDRYDSDVRRLVAQMTPEEKVGQMTQITLEQFGKSGSDGYFVLDEQKLREGIVEHHLGSILNNAGQARTVKNWQEILTKMQDLATKETRLHIPIIYGLDTIHGANYVLGATLFPQNIAMGAAGNVALAQKEGEIAALETRAAGVPWNFGPVLDLARQPMWPRVFETYGEDPYLAGTMGAAFIQGQQGNDLSSPVKVATCMKHYLGYCHPWSGADRTPAYIPERQMREWFLRPYQAAVKAGTVTCMANSSEINGIPVHSSKFYLTDLLRGELGFKGFVVSDWADIENLYKREMVAKDRREAVKMAVLAGVDMSMVPFDYGFYDTLLQLVKDGEVPMKRIDEAVTSILEVKYALGLFKDPYPRKELAGQVGAESSRQVNLQAAQEAMTLLKNEGNLLPLAKDRKVLVTGPTANKLCVLNGGWSTTWQGDQEELYPQEKNTILEAVQSKVGKDNVTYVEGVAFDKEIDVAKAVAAAANVDVIVACIGEPPYCETPGNINDLTMTEPQLKLVREMAAAGKPIVLVLVEGRPRVIRTIVDNAQAVLMAYLPGQEGGQAVADVLFGDANPSGKLPLTYPKYPTGFMTYDHKNSEEQGGNKYDPQWPFGHGLSYTTFEYRGLRADASEMGPGDKLTVTVEVTNKGTRVGKEIVQLYLTDVVATITPPVRVLKRFEKVELKPGEMKTVRFELTWDDLSFIGRENKPVVEPGEFKAQIGQMSVSFTARAGKK